MNEENNTNQAAAQAAEPVNVQPKRIRRVGTFTMGAALVLLGITLCAALIVPGKDLLFVAKLSPLVLVALGIEILIGAIFFKSEKIKYDGLSIFMCLVLIAGSVCVSLIPLVFSYIGPARESAQRSVSGSIEDALFEKKDKLPAIYEVRVSADLSPSKEFTGEETYKDLTNNDQLYGYVSFSGSYTDKVSFARDALKLLTEMEQIAKNKNLRLNVNSKSDSNSPYYELDFYGRFSKSLNEQQLEKMVIEYKYDEKYGTFISDAERQQANDIYEEASDAAQEVREEADSYAQNIREEADSYAQNIREEADSYAQNIREEADNYAQHTREEADTIRQNVQNAIAN